MAIVVKQVRNHKSEQSGKHSIVIDIDTNEEMSKDNDNMFIMLEHALTEHVFKHDYNIFIEGKSVSKQYIEEFVTNMISQIANLTIMSNCKMFELISADILQFDLTEKLVNVMY